jgi:hypothetical protein
MEVWYKARHFCHGGGGGGSGGGGGDGSSSSSSSSSNFVIVVAVILFQIFTVSFANPANMMETCEPENAEYMMPCIPNDREMMLMVGRRDLHLNVYPEPFW